MAHTLTRWEPFADLADLRSRFDRMFSELGGERAWTPAVDVRRDDGRLLVRADVPGMKPEEITIQVADDVLTLTGRHEESDEERDGDYVRRERRYGTFSRSLVLPPGVDPEAITASTHNGVLEVAIPLPSETAKEPVTITPTSEA